MKYLVLKKHAQSLCGLLSFICCALLIVSAVHVVNAQSPDVSTVVYMRRGLTSYDFIRQGSNFKVAVIFEFHNQWDCRGKPKARRCSYMNSNQPLDPQFIPTKLELTNLQDLNGLTFGLPVYPKGKKKRLAFANQPLSVYEGYKQIEFVGHADKNIPIGQYQLKGRLTYQICSDDGCNLPMSKDVIIPIEIVDPETEVRWNKYYFGAKPTARDLLLGPGRLLLGIGECLFKGCS